jgi:hypothetical protein
MSKKPEIDEYAQMNSETPVDFPVTDGTSVIVSDFTYGVLMTMWDGIDRVKAVKAGNSRYLYTPVPIPDMSYANWYFNRSHEPRVMAWDRFVAYNVLFLHQHLAGDGRIVHDGSDSFLPSNYNRQEFPEYDEVDPEPESGPKPRRVAVVGPEVINQQLQWLSDKELVLKARRCAAKKTNQTVAHDVVQIALLAVLTDVQDGQVKAVAREKLFAYAMRVVRNMCCDAANVSFCDDPYEAKAMKNGERRVDYPDESRALDDHERTVNDGFPRA